MPFERSRKPTAEARRRHGWEIALFLTAVALLFAIGIAEEMSPSFRKETQARPVTAGVLSSLVLALFAIAVIERHLTSRADRQWESARAIQLQGINHDLRQVRDSLVALSTGEMPFEPLPLLSADALEVTARTLTKQGSGPCFLCRSAERNVVLPQLMSDAEWVKTVYPSLRVLGHWFRQRVNLWILSGSPSQVSWDLAQGFSEVASAVENLTRPMYPVHRDEEGAVREDRREMAAGYWEKVLRATIAVEEIASLAQTERTYDDATKKAREGGWSSAARHLITADSRAFLNEFDGSVAAIHELLDDEGLSPSPSSEAVPRHWARTTICGPDDGDCPTAARIMAEHEKATR